MPQSPSQSNHNGSHPYPACLNAVNDDDAEAVRLHNQHVLHPQRIAANAEAFDKWIAVDLARSKAYRECQWTFLETPVEFGTIGDAIPGWFEFTPPKQQWQRPRPSS